MIKNWIQIVTIIGITVCLISISSIGTAQNNQKITFETEDGLILQEPNADQLQNESLDQQQNRMIPSNLEVRHPLGSIWQQNEWPNPAVNFTPIFDARPAGDLYGSGMQNVTLNGIFNDERDDDISSQTGKTFIYSANQNPDNPDVVLYDNLMPVGDINGSGKANLYSEENSLIYEHDGSEFVSFPANLHTESGPNWQNIMVDIDGDGNEDAIRFTQGTNLEVRFGSSDLLNLTIEEYNLANLLDDEGLFVPQSISRYKDHFVHDGTTYLMVRGLEQNDPQNQGRYLLIVSINSNREIELEQFFKFSGVWVGNLGNLFHVNIEGDDFPSLVYSHPLEDDPSYAESDDLEHLTYMFSPSDEPDKLFNEERIPIYSRMANRLGDLNGDGNTDLIVEGDDELFYLGSIDSESNTVLVGDKIKYQGDEGNLNYNIVSNVSNRLFGDLTGNGLDNYRFRLQSSDVGGVMAGGTLFLNSVGSEIFQEEVVVNLADYQLRSAYLVFPLGDVTGNGIEDFAVEYRISNAPTELAIHEGGANWDTPYQVIEMPSEAHRVRDLIAGHFTDSDRRDIAAIIEIPNDDFSFIESKVWLLEGGASISETPDRIITAESYFPGLDEDSYSRFFMTMENVGDVNGSGYDDLLFGSWVGEGSSPDASEVPAGLYFGGPELSTNGPDVVFPFEDTNIGSFGIGMTLKGLGDINNNGINDFAIVNFTEDNTQDFMDFGASAGGRVHIYYGNEEGEFDAPDLTLRSDTTSLLNGNNMQFFGFNEIATGDFNNDGQAQLAIKSFRHHVNSDISAGVPGIHIFDPANESSQPEFLIGQRTDLYATAGSTDESEFIGVMGRMLMAGVPGEAGDGLLTIGSNGFTNAVIHRNDGTGGLEPHTVYMAPNQNITMGTPATFIGIQFRTPLADYTGDGEMNFITVQRNDSNFRDSPVYMYEIEQSAVSTESVADVPEQFRLEQNYPNPFNPSSIISYQLPEMSNVRLEIFDMLGRKVATLVNGRVEAGSHEVQFDASHLSSGIYLYRLQAGNFTQTKRMTLIK